MIFNFSHQKGGTGKSIMAYHTTKAFIDKGYRVRLLDLDNQDTCISINELRDVPLEYIINIENDKQLIDIINEANEDEVLIIDSGGFDSSLTRLAIMGSDINITPVADKVTEILAVIKKYSLILEEIETKTNQKVSSYILLNKIHIFAQNFEHLNSIFKNQKRMKILNTIIRDRGIYDKSLVEGKTVQETPELKGHEDASYEINKLAEELINIYKGKQK